MWQMHRHQNPRDSLRESLLGSRLHSQQVSQAQHLAYRVLQDGITLIQEMVVAPRIKLVENAQLDINVQINAACLFCAAQGNIMPSWRVRRVPPAQPASTVRMPFKFPSTVQRANMHLLALQYAQIVLVGSTRQEIQMHARRALPAAPAQMPPSHLHPAKRALTAPP